MVKVRRATAEDTARIVDIITQAYAPYRERLSGIPDVTLGITQEVADQNVFVASDAGQILGVLVCNRSDDRFLIANLAVATAAQGQGVGATLMQYAELEAQNQGYVHLEIRTHIGMSGTRAFYERLGWVEVDVSRNTVSLQKVFPYSCEIDQT